MAYAASGKLEEARAQANTLLEYFPSANLQYFRIIYAHHKRAEDLALRLDRLREAGIPEWPFAFEDRPEDRLGGSQVHSVSFGQTWQGQHEDGERFLLQITEDGTAAYSSPSSLRTGSLSVRDNMLCYQSKDFMLGRQNCGYIYRNAAENEYEYVYANAFSVMHFSLAQ